MCGERERNEKTETEKKVEEYEYSMDNEISRRNIFIQRENEYRRELSFGDDIISRSGIIIFLG